MAVPSPGSHARARELLSAPLGRIVFAGTDSDCAPGFENALDSGLEATQESVPYCR